MRTYTRRDAVRLMGMFAGTTVLSGCAYNPVTGRRELMLMTEQQEIEMGRQAHEDIIRQYGTFDNEQVQAWVAARGMEMGRVTHRSGLTYHFTVLDSPVVNAFAVPGGYLYVTRGILGYFNNEAQFAGVLCHELGHVNARHSARQYSKAQLATLALNLGTVFSEEFARYAQFASLGMSMLFLKFSRDDEREADELGVEYSSAAGYNATEMSAFFGTLERMQPAGSSLPFFLSTHPNPANRMDDTRSMALDYQRSHPEQTYVVGRDDYLDVIDGIVFGDDPRQGYVADGVFYHPGLRFMFPVPDAWQVTNSPTELRMQPEDGSALLIFTVTANDTPVNAATQFAEQNGVTVESTETVALNGRQTVVMTGIAEGGQGTVGLMSYFVPFAGGIYEFHGVTAPDALGTYAPAFRASAAGLGELSDPARLSVAPERIELRQVSAPRTFSQALNGFGVPADRLDSLAVLNGLQLGDSLPAGMRLKIVG